MRHLLHRIDERTWWCLTRGGSSSAKFFDSVVGVLIELSELATNDLALGLPRLKLEPDGGDEVYIDEEE